MNWTAMALFVVGVVIVLAGAVAGTLQAIWRRQERKDGLR